MSDVKLICNKSFSDDDGEIVERLIGFQQALIDRDFDELNDIALDVEDFINIIGKSQSKDEFLSEVREGNLVFSVCEILDPTILFDDDNAASLIAKIRLTVKIYEKELRLITDSVVSFQKLDEKWCIGRWDTN